MTTLPTHQWRFDEIDGSLAEDAMGGVQGRISQATRVAPGYTGIGAIKLDGSNSSYVDLTTQVGQFGTENFTVSFWISTTDTLALFDLIGNRTAEGNGNFFSVRMNANGQVFAELDEDSSGKNYVGVSGSIIHLNDGKWHNIAVVRRGIALYIYVDGKLAGVDQAIGTTNIANGNPLKLGRSLISKVGRFSPNATFDDVRVYDQALDEHEIMGILTWPLPDELRLLMATGLLDTGDTGYFSASSDSFLAVDGNGILSASTTDKAQAARFSFSVSGDKLLIACNGKYVKVGDGGVLKASGELPREGSVFYPYLSANGTLILATSERQIWRLNDDNKISVATTTRIDLVNEFTLNLEQRSAQEILARHNTELSESLTPCELAWAGFVWQVTGGLFLALGLGPFIGSGTAKTGVFALLRANARVWSAIEQASATILNSASRNPKVVATAAFSVIGAVWGAGLMWSVVKLALKGAGWWAIGRVVAKIIEVALAPELEAADLLASFVVWTAQTIQAALALRTDCNGAECIGKQARGRVLEMA